MQHLFGALHYLDEFPAFGLTEWTCLPNTDDIAHVAGVIFVMGVEFRCPANYFLVQGVCNEAVCRDGDTLVHLVADDHALPFFSLSSV